MKTKQLKLLVGLVLGFATAGWVTVVSATTMPLRQEQPANQDDESEKSAKQQIDEIIATFETRMTEFSKEYRSASEEDRQKIIDEKLPKASDYSGRLMELAKQHADDPAAVDALSWVFSRGRGDEASNEALEILLRDHVENEKLKDIVLMMSFGNPSQKIQDSIKRIINESPHHSVQGIATYGLAQFYSRVNQYQGLLDDPRIADSLAEEDLQYIKDFKLDPSQHEALYQTIVDQYGDVEYRNRTLGKLAGGALFEIKYLSIGKQVPDIEGADLDGEAFKLSDYRGKVVVIDFWGDW